MSPLPNRPLQPPKSPASPQAPLDEQPLNDASSETHKDPAESPPSSSSEDSSDTAPLTPQRPLMRPVARPVMPPKAIEPEPTPPPPIVEETPEAPPDDGLRHKPIPAPSEPMQYRAIGLLRGRYTASEEQFTRGTLFTTDGTEIQAVLLGRVMSLVRNHLDLEQDHLWVVYPRTREKEEDLHAQIVGVWEPEKLNKAEEGDGEPSEDEEPPIVYQPSSEADDDYFSIRGEVIFHTPEENSLVVKIQQAPRKKDGNRSKCFKLKLEGTLTGKVVGYFWDLQVRRRGDGLVIEKGTPIGMIPPKKKPKSSFSRGSGDRPRRDFASPRPFNRAGGASKPTAGAPSTPAPARKDPLPKPVKKRDTNTTEA
ncbi:hypothetical protein ACKFKF_08780 [Phormidesmis sp. 146-12]